MIDVTSYRRVKAKVFNLHPLEENKKDMAFNVNGIHIELKHGEEVELLEPVFNALKDAKREEHEWRTIVDWTTGIAQPVDTVKTISNYEVVKLGDFYWPEGHKPADEHVNPWPILEKKQVEESEDLVEDPSVVESKDKRKK